MKLQLIRNATLRLTYHGHLMLLDPCLAPRHGLPAFAGGSRNPTVALPMSPEEVLEGVELVVVSHLHPDHFDDSARELLSKDVPVATQPGDESTFSKAGFTNITIVEDAFEWRGIKITRTPGRHGTAECAERLGHVSGFVFHSRDEPTVYWAGDTIWYEPILEVIQQFEPDVIVTNSGGAHFGDGCVIIMDVEQTLTACEVAAQATVVAVHLESLDHCPVTRAELRAAADEAGIGPDRLRIPDDGEVVEIDV